ncbi:BnaA05g36650D [Brassica napus]|uniref:non-specific serine/threonine protein kinase n=1 Tax=Brassica napus TaxID=3708 RepID=A0A078IQU8_BRANA|nr:BnaA05g36650D [Brassica napus]
MEKHPQALRLFALICITFSSLLHIVEAQDQKGFISLDCGSPPNEPPYNDVQTGLTFSTDNGFVQTGKTGKVQKEIESLFPKPVWNLRYFPDGIRNCYTLNVTQGSKYLIRALFVYGNYDGLNEYPSFDLYLGPNLLETIDLSLWGQVECSRRSSTNPYLRLCRYPNDVSDRAWIPNFNEKNWTQVTTNLTVNTSNGYNPPQVVMASASTPISAFASWNFTWLLFPSTTQFYIYMHFAEIQSLQANETREFKLLRTSKSTLPPLINAIEIYMVIDFPLLETNQDDEFLWDGLNCDNSNASEPPIVTYLNLSSSQLTGIIAPGIQNLTNLKELDLSNNNLTGGVPEFLAGMKALLVINLSGNNLNGSIPQDLLKKKGLKLISDGNPDLICADELCANKSAGSKKKSSVVPIVVSVVVVVVLGSALAFFFVFRKKKTPNSADPRTTRSSVPAIMTKNRRFTYSEVVTMTNNFEKILGKGGFGMVYHGTVNGTEQVAVKVLSHSSSQGYKEFKAEVELLLRVHHKNLVRLVGYCDEGENLALIYEYMANGDLREHMSGKRGGSILNWETRLKIVVQSAQGLEYLHNGCKPPMIHRDVKTTNILLNEHFQAKLADFGLSRSFPVEGETHVSTVVAGTPGYLDPEYYRTNWLNEKSDVYSFGIVLLEIITNQPVINQNRENPYIAEWVGVMLTEGDIQNIVDPKLHGDYDSGSVWRAVELAMSCLNPSSARRPTMSEVVTELNECLAYENSREGTSQNMTHRVL